MRTYAPADAATVLGRVLEEPSLTRGVVHHEVIPAREPSYADMPAWLDPRIVHGLANRGIERLYTHQAEAIEAVHAGRGRRRRHAHRLGQDALLRAACPAGDRRRPGRAGAVPVPDQGARPGPGDRIRRARRHRPDLSIITSTYDGDTPAPIRSTVRAAGQVVVTNPDMLHSAILPHHTKWFQLFEQLQLIVIDELHTYRGVFGSHVANVLRRLMRICAHYGSKPLIVCCSATIGNPCRARRRC